MLSHLNVILFFSMLVTLLHAIFDNFTFHALQNLIFLPERHDSISLFHFPRIKWKHRVVNTYPPKTFVAMPTIFTITHSSSWAIPDALRLTGTHNYNRKSNMQGSRNKLELFWKKKSPKIEGMRLQKKKSSRGYYLPFFSLHGSFCPWQYILSISFG